MSLSADSRTTCQSVTIESCRDGQPVAEEDIVGDSGADGRLGRMWRAGLELSLGALLLVASASSTALAVDDGSQMASTFRINYLGYFQHGDKIALFLSTPAGGSKAWELVDGSGKAVATGISRDYVRDDFASGRQLLPDRLLELHAGRRRLPAEHRRPALRAVRRRRPQSLRRPRRPGLRLLQGPPHARAHLRPVPPRLGDGQHQRAASGTTPATRGSTRPTPRSPPGSS